MDYESMDLSSMNNALRSITMSCLDSLDANKSPSEIEAEVTNAVAEGFDVHNTASDKGHKWVIPDCLNHMQIAEIMLKKEPIKMLNLTSSNSTLRKYMVLAMYNSEAKKWDMDETYIRGQVRKYNYRISKTGIDEVISVLREKAPIGHKCDNPDLIPLANVIYDYANKTTIEYSPEYIFTNKSPIEYVDYSGLEPPKLINPDGTVWTFDEWIESLSDNPEVVLSIWEILSASLRPLVKWNCAAWIYGTGNNGKGCITQLIRSLVGDENCASIPLKAMSQDFMLEPLTRITAIVVDENDDDYIDNAANIKTVVTGDTLHINVKFGNPIQVQPHIFMVQCMNSLPRCKAKEDGFYRRQLFIPLDKCFDGCENKRIKSIYLNDKRVLQYIIWKVLATTNFYDFTVTETSKAMSEEYQIYNNPIKQFATEIIPVTTWNFLPLDFLFSCYKEWFKENNPSGKLIGKYAFRDELLVILREFGGFRYHDRKNPISGTSTNCFTVSEPLIAQYGLTDWMAKDFKGDTSRTNDVEKLCTPTPRGSMTGWKKL